MAKDTIETAARCETLIGLRLARDAIQACRKASLEIVREEPSYTDYLAAIDRLIFAFEPEP